MNQTVAPETLSVSQLNAVIKAVLDTEPLLSHVMVRGELSNFKHHIQSGHLYMTLKDEKSSIRAVMFASSAKKLTFRPENGMKVIVEGRVAVFERDGQYQLYLTGMQPDGLGALHLAFEQLKKKLEEEGLFDPARKKPIPKTPLKIGVVTASTGAAVRDIIHVLNRRFSAAKVLLYPVLVQGPEAAPMIVEALAWFNREHAADLLIVGRGGGSLEDLWAFNEEIVARAIAGSKIPVISAVGHETDFTIADFVADLRAPTPSAAAELAVPDSAVIRQRLENVNRLMADLLLRQTSAGRIQVQTLAGHRNMQTPLRYIEECRLTIDSLIQRVYFSQRQKLDAAHRMLGLSAGKLEALSPLSVLERGFSIAFKENKPVRSAELLSPGDTLSLRFAKGGAEVLVTKTYVQSESVEKGAKNDTDEKKA
ncbi:MAG: exodeoxyribonuclease VII large subunit [Clostridia bacterium]|nr:exodeoxyribonuclease VII large subunit [Clostridia bacterium]